MDNLINCIGVDGKRHLCEPNSDKCECGMKIKTKKIGRNDWKRATCSNGCPD